MPFPNPPARGRSAPCARSRPAPTRRLLLESLQSRQLLATLAVPIQGTIFDTTSAAPHAETSNLLAEIASRGHTAITFTGVDAASLAAPLAAADAIVIPEQEFASLNEALSSDAKTALAQFVHSGGGMIVLGSPSGRTESLLNSLFGYSLTAIFDGGGVAFLRSEEVVGTTFASGPSAIFTMNIADVTEFDVSPQATLPTGVRFPYLSGSVAPTALFDYGQGQIVYLGYDFDNPGGQAHAANWKTLLGLAIEQVAATAPAASVELNGGNLVIADIAGGNDAFSLAADSLKWTISIESGAFAPATIPGVTVADNTVIIDKSLAVTFTGEFVFQGGDGNDILRLTVDDLGRDVQFDGGDSAGDDDLLELVSVAGVGSLASAPDMNGGGTLDIGNDGDAEIFYSGLEPVDLTGVQAQQLHFAVPAGITTAELIDHLAPNDTLSRLAFGGAGPEDQYFRHPSQLLAVHTSGNTIATLFPLDPTLNIPELLLDGTPTDLFYLGATGGIRGGTSLTLVEATLDLYSNSPLINGLSGNGTITNSANTNSVLTIGASGAGGDYGGTISDGWPASDPPPTTRKVGIFKAGSGSQRLSGGHTFSGTTEVAEGTLVLDGSLHANSQVTVRGGATLSGVGAAEGSLVVDAGGKIEPGSPGSLPGSNRGGSETWSAGSQFAVQLGGTTPGSGHDQRRIGGSAILDGALLEVSLAGGFVPTAPAAFTIVDNLGSLPIGGTFDGLPEGALVNVPLSPLPLFITYQGGDGNDVVLFSAPVTPGTAVVSGTPGDDTLVLEPATPGGTELRYSLNGGPFVLLGVVESLSIELGAGEDRVTFQGATEVAGDLAIEAERIEIGGPLSVGGALELTSHGLLRIDAAVVAQGPVWLTTTDAGGRDADLAIGAAVTSRQAGLVLSSADNAIIRGALSAATTIDIAIDAASSDGEGNTLFLQAPLTAPGGTTAVGSAAADRFEIEPQTGSTLAIVGGGPVAPQSHPQSQNAHAGDVGGDQVVLDMTTAGDGAAVAGPVVVDSVGGLARAENIGNLTYAGIEDLDLLDGGTLTTAEQGDLYVRGTDLDERIYVGYDGRTNPLLRVSVQGRMFPPTGFFGPYVAGRSVIMYGRGGRDFLEMSAAPMRGQLHGEGGDDYLTGTAYGDLLVGGRGSDILIGGWSGGDDELWGDDFDPIPKDEIGQPIADPTAEQLAQNRVFWAERVSPADGNDRLTSAGGNDRHYGQGGHDRLNAGAGDDYANGGSGNDLITGGDGNDRLYGSDGSDTLSGDGGHDLLSGGEGNDYLYGRLGNDVLIGGDGADELKGNEGDDLLLAGIVTVGDGAGPAPAAESIVAGDAADQAMLALLIEWSTLAQLTGVTHLDDGDLDWLYGHTGSDRFASDGTSQNYDFVAGVDG